MTFKTMRFEDILPHLVDSYRRDILVPFIGSGMSMPACTGWQAFVKKLTCEAGLKLAEPPKLPDGSISEIPASEFYRRADKAVHRLRHKGAEERAESYRRALLAHTEGSSGLCDVPPQTKALALLKWPLVLTTNYDDLYLQARSQRMGNPSEVLGRSIEDCHKVIRSLDAPSQPILWALQGFLGGQAAQPHGFIEKPERRHELIEQLVVGHQQYQTVTNAQPHFRRAFAEVFHRRSFLFLGSGLSEDYLINLFGEILHHFGPCSRPHFALTDKKSVPDPQFLERRLGIVPIFYDDHDKLPGFLSELAERARGSSAHMESKTTKHPVAWRMDELGFSLADGSIPLSGTARRLKLRYVSPASVLPVPAKGGRECTIASLLRDGRNMYTDESQQGGLLERAESFELIEHADAGHWRALDDAPSYVYRFGTSPIFGVLAWSLSTPNKDIDRRGLGIIPDAVCAALQEVNAAGFREVNLGPVASGAQAPWHPRHQFVQTLVGVRRFFANTQDAGIETLVLPVFEPSLWSEIVSGKLPVSEILSSEVTKIWVDIRDAEGVPEFHSVTVYGSTTVGQLKDLCGLERERWTTTILPPSRKPSTAKEENELEVAPTSIIIFSPTPATRATRSDSSPQEEPA